MLSAPPDCVWTPCLNCLVRKRIASKALWDLIAKFIQPSWKTTRKNIVWLSQLFVPFLSKQLLSAAYFPILVDNVVKIFFMTTSRPLLSRALLWCIFCQLRTSFCSHHFSLAEVLQWPWQLLSLWHSCDLGITPGFPMTGSPALTPHGSRGGRIQKGAGKQKIKLLPAGLAALHPL